MSTPPQRASAAPGTVGAAPGTVYLVGAGPGDPRLMTARALELVADADVVLYDRLVEHGALAGASADANLVFVGKQPGRSRSQAEINDLMASHAREGRSVVRLKGGDPFVFGRGGEEAIALAEAGVPFEVVPGVTSGVAAPAYAGIPVTHRGAAAAVAFVTGHEDPGKPPDAGSVDWEALARFPGTLVLYMGTRNLGPLAGRLVAAGRDSGEPAAVIERGTTSRQRTFSATLGDLASGRAGIDAEPPSVTVIGSVTALRERIAWFEGAPLFGVSVTVTRARSQASALAQRLRGLGAGVVEAPAISIVPRIATPAVRRAVADIDRYGVVCFTSANGADLLFAALGAAGRDARALAGKQVAAIGPGTAAALARHGIEPDIVPAESLPEGLVRALAAEPLEGVPVLLARAQGAREVLPDALRTQGAKVDDVALYETVPAPLGAEQLAAAAASDYVTFTSASTVRSFFDALECPGRLRPSVRLASIGPVTSSAIRARGLDAHVEADKHDIPGLVDAIVADARRRASHTKAR